MWRIYGLFLGASMLVASVPAQVAFSAGGDTARNDAHQQTLVAQAGKPLTERQKCLALNKCRRNYTICYDKLVAAHKNIETHKIECVKPYQKCINASFGGFDWMFTRWFNPSVIDCKKYPG